MRNLKLIASLLPLLSFTACTGWNEVETGNYGLISLTPDDCGRDVCDLDDDIAIGGLFHVELRAEDGGSVSDLTLISSDPYVMDVGLLYDGVFESEWEVIGYSSGFADLIAIDAWGYEVDYVTVSVRASDRVDLRHEAGQATFKGAAGEVEEVWEVAAGQAVRFDVDTERDGFELMGQLAYDVVIDELLLEAQRSDADLIAGELAFTIAAGDYPVSFTSPDGRRADILIQAR